MLMQASLQHIFPSSVSLVCSAHILVFIYMKTRISRKSALYVFRQKNAYASKLATHFYEFCLARLQCSYSCFHLHENKNLSGVRPIRIQAEKCLCKQACNTFFPSSVSLVCSAHILVFIYMKTRISRAFALYGFRQKNAYASKLATHFSEFCLARLQCSYSCFHLHENKNLSGVRPIRIQAEKCLCKQACNTFFRVLSRSFAVLIFLFSFT